MALADRRAVVSNRSSPIRTVSPDDTLSAAHTNEIVNLANRMKNLTVGAGIEMTVTDLGVQINLAARKFERIPARVTASTAAGAMSGVASDVTYTVQAIGRPDIPALTMMEPKYGRPTKNDELHVYYAEVGDLCYLIPKPSADMFGYDLEVITEVGQFGECPAPSP